MIAVKEVLFFSLIAYAVFVPPLMFLAGLCFIMGKIVSKMMDVPRHK
jgi:hypothetical protein